MKIAIVTCVFPPYRGGIGEAAHSHASILSGFNHSVTVFTPGGNGRTGESDLNSPFKVERLNSWLNFGNAAFLPALFSKLDKFDIVQLHYPFFGAAEIIWLKNIYNKSYKFSIHYHMDTLDLPVAKKILSLPSLAARSSLFRQAELVTCASLDYIRHSQIKDIYKACPGKFREIPFAKNLDVFCPARAPKQSSKNRLLFIGGLDQAHYFKGLDVLFKALSGIKIDCELSVIGDGNLRSGYEKQAEKFGLSGNIKFLGSLETPDMIRHLQLCDLLVLPSVNSHEAFGLVLIEAMACGCPVLASNLPGVRKVFKAGEHGFLARPGDYRDLAEKIILAFRDKDKLRLMGEKARKHAENNYSQEKMSAALNNIISGL